MVSNMAGLICPPRGGIPFPATIPLPCPFFALPTRHVLDSTSTRPVPTFGVSRAYTLFEAAPPRRPACHFPADRVRRVQRRHTCRRWFIRPRRAAHRKSHDRRSLSHHHYLR